ncbi:MAG: hypothetical protein PHQ40_18065 [Anaerolineaceae bacterium]|nr:hypothetical protein [Anaerolineaceae bacterium]
MVRDLRKYARQTTIRLGVGAFLLLFIVGDGLIWWIYGPGAAVMGLICLLGGLLPITLIIIFLWGMDWVVKRANRD